HTRNGRYAGKAGLSRRATDVPVAGPDGASPDLFQPRPRYPDDDAGRVATDRGHQQLHPQWRSLSRAKGSAEADRSRGEAARKCQGRRRVRQCGTQVGLTAVSNHCFKQKGLRKEAFFVPANSRVSDHQTGRNLVSEIWYSIDVV